LIIVTREVVDQRQRDSVDFFERLASNALKISAHTGGRLNNTADLRFAFRPKTDHRFAFHVEVRLHLGKFLDDRFEP